MVVANLGSFADTIFQQKYAQRKANGQLESWNDCARRVVGSVMAPYAPRKANAVEDLVIQRKLMPAGRYLYCAGRRYAQTNNCQSGDTRIVTRTGIAAMRELVGQQIEVLNRFGQWEQATVHSFGLQQLYRIRFHNGDSTLATAGHRWWMEDGTRITTPEIDHVPLNRHASFPLLDEEGIRHGIAYGDGTTQRKLKTDRLEFCTANKASLAEHFTGYRQTQYANGHLTVTRLPKHYKQLPDLTHCTPGYARGFIAGLIATDGSTRTASITIAVSDPASAEKIRELAVLGGCVVSGVTLKESTSPFSGKPRTLCLVRIKPFSAPLIRADQIQDVSSRKLHPRKMYLEVVSIEPEGEPEEVFCVVAPQSESYTLSNGLISSNCFLFRAEDSREGWADLLRKVTSSLMTGGGIGIVYSPVRPSGTLVGGMGGLASGPIALMEIVNEVGRRVRQGGSRRSAIWAGLHWDHADIMAYCSIKDWPKWVVEQKAVDFNTPAPMDGTNISVILDDEFFRAYGDSRHEKHSLAQRVYWHVVHSMCKTGEPGFSIDIGENAGENERNACVPAGTKILTREGDLPIETLVGRSVDVWNGEQWAPVTPKLTGYHKTLLKVTLEDGRSLVCTDNHKFPWDINTGDPDIEEMLEARFLKPGDSIIDYPLPDSLIRGKFLQKIAAVEFAGVAQQVYCFNEPHSHRGTFNGIVTGQCTEVTSRTDSDVCNLASLNMARFKTLDEFAAAIPLSIGFLLCNTLYSQLPLEEMKRVRDVNRRLGLGLMGMHEWLLLRGKSYGPDEELASWLDVYATESEKAARAWARRLEVNVPIATRAIAPTGTIAILAETTSGIEPIFASAYKRRYLKGDIWHAQYVIDAAAQRVVDAGVAPEAIEDAYDLAADVERRIAFQAFVQKYVDMGISSTINLPAWGSPHNCEATVTRFGEILMQYLPKLRGITTYPDGSRGGQPLNKVPYSEAVTRAGVEFAENGNESGCVSGVCGI